MGSGVRSHSFRAGVSRLHFSQRAAVTGIAKRSARGEWLSISMHWESQEVATCACIRSNSLRRWTVRNKLSLKRQRLLLYWGSQPGAVARGLFDFPTKFWRWMPVVARMGCNVDRWVRRMVRDRWMAWIRWLIFDASHIVELLGICYRFNWC